MKFKGLTTDKQVAEAMEAIVPRDVKNSEILFLCIGTDRSTGDSLGPWTGTLLKKKGLRNVLGTLEEPVHAMNLEFVVIPDKIKYVMAIDASLGMSSSVKTITVEDKPLRPGAGVQKDLGEWGDGHIAGVVNVGGFMEYFVLQNTRLGLVAEMSQSIVDGIMMFRKARSKKTTRKRYHTVYDLWEGTL